MNVGAAGTPWHAHPMNVSSLYRYLVDQGRLDPSNVDAVARMLAEPWAHDASFQAMKREAHAILAPRGKRL